MRDSGGSEPGTSSLPVTKGPASVEDMQKLSKENADNAQKAFIKFYKELQSIATEMSDFSKNSFEDGSLVLKQLSGAKNLAKVVEIQSDYARKAYESLLSRSAVIGGLYGAFGFGHEEQIEGLLFEVPSGPKVESCEINENISHEKSEVDKYILSRNSDFVELDGPILSLNEAFSMLSSAFEIDDPVSHLQFIKDKTKGV